MVFVIPSQTLFQERTPPTLMGRVVGFRFALVFGSMTLAMGARAGARRDRRRRRRSSAFFGLVTMVAGPRRPVRAGDPRRLTDGGRGALRYTGARVAPDERRARQE